MRAWLLQFKRFGRAHRSLHGRRTTAPSLDHSTSGIPSVVGACPMRGRSPALYSPSSAAWHTPPNSHSHARPPRVLSSHFSAVHRRACYASPLCECATAMCTQPCGSPTCLSADDAHQRPRTRHLIHQLPALSAGALRDASSSALLRLRAIALTPGLRLVCLALSARSRRFTTAWRATHGSWQPHLCAHRSCPDYVYVYDYWFVGFLHARS